MLKRDAAFVLHRYPYRESSVLLRCFTEQEGIISLIARGVRQAKSPKKALLQPFCPLFIHYRMGRGALAHLEEVELRDTWAHPASSSLLSGFYVNELLLKLLPEHENFLLLFQAYQELVLKNFDEFSLRMFEKQLLFYLGFSIDFERDHLGRLISAEYHYQFLS